MRAEVPFVIFSFSSWDNNNNNEGKGDTNNNTKFGIKSNSFDEKNETKSNQTKIKKNRLSFPAFFRLFCRQRNVQRSANNNDWSSKNINICMFVFCFV